MRRLTLRQFKVFEAVARQLSFSKAAAELHLSQPAVSMQVKGLEAIVGLPLTEQLGKKIFLTEAGREVLHASQRITAQLNDLQTNLAQLRGSSTSPSPRPPMPSPRAFSPSFAAGIRRYRSIWLYPTANRC
jgi:DNA-binding transcriptional LysR family regulator